MLPERRIIEVYDPNGGSVGSGYLLTSRLVLTARHVVEAALPRECPPTPEQSEFEAFSLPSVHPRCRLRPLDRTGRSKFVDAIAVWWMRSIDAALLLILPNPEFDLKPVASLSWSDLSTADPIDVTAVGFPDADSAARIRDSRQIFGIVAPLSGVKNNRWVVHVHGSIGPPRSGSPSAWAGMSGAALFADQFLIGILEVDADPVRPERMELWALPVRTFAMQKDFGAWIRWDGGTEAWKQSAVGPFGTYRMLREVTGATQSAGTHTSAFPPRQLPKTVTGFVGRESEHSDLSRLFTNTSESKAILITALSGMGGVGKTALAVKWAHDVASRFPDGQLFVELRGHDPVSPPRDSADVLNELLAGMNVKPADVPAQLTAKAAMFRTLLANRQTLIILDNAASAEQVRPLLPASNSAVVLITSRSNLSGLVARDGVERIRLGTLPEDKAVELLRLAAGDHDQKVSFSALAELAYLCSYLPLALRIAGEKISNHLDDIDTLIRDLSQKDNRLSALGTDDDESSEVRAVFFWSYKDLPADAAKMFRLIGLHSGAEISVGAAAALANVSRNKASNTLHILSSANVLDYLGGGRYKMHDLLRLYARERAQHEEEPEEKHRAVARVLTWYLHGADAADRVLRSARMRPTLDQLDMDLDKDEVITHTEAMQWCDREEANLTSGVVQAADFGLHTIAWKLPISMWGYLTQSRKWSNWVAPYKVAEKSARSLGDVAAESWATHNLGQAYRELKLYTEAQECYNRALALRRESGDRWGEAHTLTAMGACQLDQGNLQLAIEYFNDSLRIHELLSDPSGQGATLERLGDAYRGLGDIPNALSSYERALELWVEIRHELGRGWVFNSIGLLREREGDTQEAISNFRRALSIHRQIMHKYGVATILMNLGRNLIDLGQIDEGRACWRDALALFKELVDPRSSQLHALIEALDLSNTRNDNGAS